MKGAAAALTCALLFFLGVLTGASGDGKGLAPPPAIPLGAQPASSRADSRTPADRAADQPAAPAVGEPPASADDPAAPAGGAPAPGDSDASSVPPAGEEPPAPGGSGGVEEVGGRVDCVAADGGQVESAQGAGAPSDGRPSDGGCPPGQDKKPADPPNDKKGDGDGRQ